MEKTETGPKGSFDPNKPVMTRDGRKARIICTNKKGAHPIVALIGDVEGVMCFTEDGKRAEDSYSLVNIPVKKEMFYPVSETGCRYGSGALTFEDAKSYARNMLNPESFVGFAKYTFEDGKLIAIELIKEYK